MEESTEGSCNSIALTNAGLVPSTRFVLVLSILQKVGFRSELKEYSVYRKSAYFNMFTLRNSQYLFNGVEGSVLALFIN